MDNLINLIRGLLIGLAVASCCSGMVMLGKNQPLGFVTLMLIGAVFLIGLLFMGRLKLLG